MTATIVHILEEILVNVVNIAILVFEFMGVSIIIWSSVNAFIKWIRKAHDTKIYLARGLAMGLEFKMGSEILRTVIVKEWMEIVGVAGIIALRAALSFLIQWEIKEEERTNVKEMVGAVMKEKLEKQKSDEEDDGWEK